ncbi:hypothetical protein [Halobacterium hubeiense]|uniref:hypothetical protein n=1 Tax=Halobacterium hubeiense TaxID=1407499 RepID=UPI000B7CB98E|nr:hypothetical protein [Halobacterium hubeiense]
MVKSDAFQKQIEDEQVEGWEIKEDGDERVLLVKRKTGTLTAHLLIFLLFGWWTIGVANVVYLAYKYFLDADEKVVRDD